MASVKNSVWVGELDRFGYTLTVVGRTEEETREALMNAYEKTYRDLNNDIDPREDFKEGYSGEEISYYDNAKEDVCVWEMAFGRVEWR